MILCKKINEMLGTAKYYCRSIIPCMILCKKINKVLGTAKYYWRSSTPLEDLLAEGKVKFVPVMIRDRSCSTPLKDS